MNSSLDLVVGTNATIEALMVLVNYHLHCVLELLMHFLKRVVLVCQTKRRRVHELECNFDRDACVGGHERPLLGNVTEDLYIMHKSTIQAQDALRHTDLRPGSQLLHAVLLLVDCGSDSCSIHSLLYSVCWHVASLYAPVLARALAVATQSLHSLLVP